MEEKECYLISGIKDRCTGCSACKFVCPVKCISMIEDEEKFIYPSIDKSKCINCKKCIGICPVNRKVLNKKYDEKHVYGFRLNDNKELLASSSGGAFTAIAQAFCTNKYAIFGATFDEDMKVYHDFVTDLKDIDRFRKSKYIQSDIKNSYYKVKEFLDNKYKVIFTGTPCQVAGLKSYLNKDYEKLLCVDVICHGIPNQEIFNTYIAHIQKKYRSKVSKINFREKIIKDGKWNSKNIRICFANGKHIIRDSSSDPFLIGYQASLFHRKSCYDCKFANANRDSDITIADCWGIESVDKNLDVHKGYSMVIINTEKGEKVFTRIGTENLIIELNQKFAEENNSCYTKSSTINVNRGYFFEHIGKQRFDKLVYKCVPIPKIEILLSKILPKKVKTIAKKIILKDKIISKL